MSGYQYGYLVGLAVGVALGKGWPMRAAEWCWKRFATVCRWIGEHG